MKILIIPDIHENIISLERIAQSTLAHEAEKIVCLGDYLDSFKHKLSNCRLVLEFLCERKDDPKWTFLLGNHDIHYHFDGKMACSGFYVETFNLWARFKEAGKLPSFQAFHTIPGPVTLSHAGIDERLTINTVHGLHDEWAKFSAGFTPNVFEQIGKERGGSHACGGPFWQDFAWLRPDTEFGLQIVGHTNGKHVRRITQGNDAEARELAICLDDNLRSVMMLATDTTSYQLHLVSELEAYESSGSGTGHDGELASMGEGESSANAA